jgi:hypothetical protein
MDAFVLFLTRGIYILYVVTAGPDLEIYAPPNAAPSIFKIPHPC